MTDPLLNATVLTPASRVPRLLTLTGRGCRLFIAAVFVVAAASKFLDLAAFRASLDSWVLLPTGARAPIVFMTPVVEIGLGAAWLFTQSRRAYLLMGATLTVFTGVYLFHVAMVGPPDCHCIVKLAAFDTWQSSVTGVVIRNTALLLVWAFGLVFGSRRPTADGTPDAA